MDDKFDSPATSDFPTDPVVNHDLLFWGVATVCLIVFASILTVLFKNAQRNATKGMAEAIEGRAKAVAKVLSPGAKAAESNQIADAEKSRAAVHEQFGRTLSLSSDLGKAVGKLNGAIEGLKEEPFVPKGAGAPGHANGGTVISIAVNSHSDGQPVAIAGVGGAAHAIGSDVPAPEKLAMTPDEKSSAVWFAVQKLFNYWKNLNVVTAAYHAAQQQIMHSPPWEDPKEDERYDQLKPRKP